MHCHWRAIAWRVGLGSWLTALSCIAPPADLPPTAAPAEAVALEVWPTGDIASLYPVGEVRAFRFEQAGHEIGRSYGRYAGPQTDPATGQIVHRFETRIELDIAAGAPARSEGEILIDDRGHLVRGFERSDAAEMQFWSEPDALVLEHGHRRETLTYRVGDGFMAYMTTLHEELMLAVPALSEGHHERRLLSLSGGLPREWEADVRRERTGVIVETNLGERIVLESRRIVEVDVADDRLRVETITPAPAWPSWSIASPTELHYTPPAVASFRIEPIELAGQPGAPTLAGELLLPPRDATTTAPMALVVSAAGQSDRYGFAGPPAVDLGEHEITDALAQAGFAVLRYDHPGFGKSPARVVSWTAQLEDARRALRTLAVQPGVDPGRLVLVGHGEGGWKALRLAAEFPDWVRGVALLGTPGRSYTELLRDRGRAMQDQLDPQVRSQAAAQYERMLDDLAHHRGAPPEFAEQAQWLYEIMAEDPVRLVGAVSCPLWIAQGDKDFETDPTLAPAKLEAAATGAVTVRHYATLDHLFKVEPDSSTPMRYLEARPVDPGFLADLTAWARRMVDEPSPRSKRARG